MFRDTRTYPLSAPRVVRFDPDQTLLLGPVDESQVVVSVEQAKAFLPVRVNTYDNQIAKLIDAVTRQVESYVRRDVILKNVQSFWFRTPQIAILPRGPHSEIIKVESINADGDITELAEGVDYRVEGYTFKQLVSINGERSLSVQFRSGYDADKIPPEIPQAILQELSLQFKNRQDPDTPAMTSVGSLSLEARHLLSSLIRRSY